MPCHQLEGEYTQSPPVDGIRMTGGCDQFRREVIRGATSCVRPADDELGQTHICQLDVPLFREEQVFGLQVAVDDAALVQVIESEDCSCDVIFGMLLAPMESLAVVGGIELSPERRFEEEVKCLGAVVGLMQLDDEDRVCHHQDVFLIHDTLLHARLDNVALAETLHRVCLASLLVLPQIDGAEASATEEPDPGKVLPQNLDLGPILDGLWHSTCALGSLTISVLP
mmetsp:Transcript_12892/g.32512  ORF Transcript_12892/g.32512 Transcript_12892/m.32512 type:complete len:226 (-) Transcript_12892:1436-2113(-)